MDLSRYRRTPPRSQPTESTTSLTGWILGGRGRSPAPEPERRTARVIAILFAALTMLVAVAAAVTYLAFDRIGSL